MSITDPFQVDTYLPYMRDVTKCEQSLRELNLMWRMIESSAKMNCPVEAKAILPTMAATRAGFGQLEKELVASLAREKIGNVLAELATKAQYVTEIVVRNLYERTADVGFLATDRDLCAFVAGLNDDTEAIRYRLRAYRNKYTVYDEIVLLDLTGNVLVQIDETTPLEGSLDPLIAQTLASDQYVETFRYSDLRPGKREALIYSRRMAFDYPYLSDARLKPSCISANRRMPLHMTVFPGGGSFYRHTTTHNHHHQKPPSAAAPMHPISPTCAKSWPRAAAA